MASTYSALKIELIGTGEQAGTWGVTTDTNLGDAALGAAITGSADVTFAGGDVTVTLTNTNTAQTARNLRLNLIGTSGASSSLILGSGCQISKLYLVNNTTSNAVTVKNTTGTGIAVPAGKTMFVFNNGTNVVDAVTYASSIATGAITATSVTDSGLTSGRVTYATTGGLLTDSANLTFNGTTLTTANDASISGLTVGKGGGSSGNNTVLGTTAFGNNTSGIGNVAVGTVALFNNTTANNNSAVGYYALVTNTTGASNTAFGSGALYSNTTASNNTAVGYQAAYTNSTGNNNTAVGYQAAYLNTTGALGVYIGQQAGYSTTVGNGNTMVGYRAGYTSNVTSVVNVDNTCIGALAGNFLTTGYGNVFVGGSLQNGGAGYSATTGIGNTFIGYTAGNAITTGGRNTILGNFTGNGAIDIRTASNYIVLSDGDGNPLAFTANSNTFALQGATISAGTGIAFPATQSASSNANTLDDYEEGTWTGAISNGTTSVSFTGSYTKVGRVVTINYANYTVNISALTDTAGQLRITGLPFASNGEHFFSAGGIWVSDSGRNYFQNAIGTTMFIWQSSSVNDVTAVSRSTFGNTTTMSVYGTYTYQTTT